MIQNKQKAKQGLNPLTWKRGVWLLFGSGRVVWIIRCSAPTASRATTGFFPKAGRYPPTE